MSLGSQRHALAHLPLAKKSGTHFTEGWVGPSVGLDGCGKSRLHQDSILGPSSPYRVAIRPTLSEHYSRSKH